MADDEPSHSPSPRNWGSFWSLMGLQAQNAFNDKALQFTLLPLGVWLAAQAGAAWGEKLPHLLGILILLPFILFAPVAGWASDTFSKTRIIRLAAWMQLAVLLVVLGAIGWKVFPLAVVCFFFLALQSTILSPAKNGIIKELLGSTHLGFASGIMQMLTILAILAGQILIGIWFSGRLEVLGEGWRAGLFPMVVITLGAVVTLVMAYSIEVVPPQAARKPFRAALVISHFRQLGQLFGPPGLRLAALGIAFFWAFGAIMQLISIQIAGQLYPDGHPRFGASASYMMLAASGGIALGSIIGALINRRHIELGLNPLGGILMTVASVLLIVAKPETAFFYAALCGAGFGAAFFFVPINAFLQDECDPQQRGNILAGSALLNCLAMVFAVAAQLAMVKLELEPRHQFLIVAVAVVGATWYVMRLLPRAFVKLLVLSALRAFYRIRAIDAKRMPDRGGVLLAPNHISYLDALVLTAASPRPVRFVMVSSYFRLPLVGKFARLFDTIPISSTQAKDAIRVAAEALAAGSVVCIFPEGRLSRSGFMGEIKRGFELIARRANCPVQAVYLDGLWKSIFSAERGKFFWKLPRSIPFGVRVAFGEARLPDQSAAAEIRRDLNALAGTAFEYRRESAPTLARFLALRNDTARAAAWWDGSRLRSCTWHDVRSVLHSSAEPESLADGHAGAAAWLADWRALAVLSDDEMRRLILNAQQLADPHDLGGGKSAVLLDGDAPPAVRRVWGMLLPVVARTFTVVLGPDDGDPTLADLVRARVKLRDLVGTPLLRARLDLGSPDRAHLRFYQFGGGPQTVADAEARTFACHQQDGLVLSLSIPHPPMIRKQDIAEPGWLEGSFGRLLTGFVARPDEAALTIESVSIDGRLELPGWSVDERGFLRPPARIEPSV